MIKNDALKIVNEALVQANPYKNVFDALRDKDYKENLVVIAAGKAACPMAKAAYDVLSDRIIQGFVLTKYNHAVDMPDIFRVYEAGHPVPDENSVRYTAEIVEYVRTLSEDNRIIFLLSGGASALFDLPAVPLDTLKRITDMLLRCSADITQINVIRKKLSLVKGGKFASLCRCNTDCYILSDVLGDRIEMIASGPCCDDLSSFDDVRRVIDSYSLDFTSDEKLLEAYDVMKNQKPVRADNCTNKIIGSLSMLCDGAADCARKMGYDVTVKTLNLTGEASERGREIGREAMEAARLKKGKQLLIYGGETTVTVRGKGKGGRNQELVLSACTQIKGSENIFIVSFGSDGTDGPTDAAGAYADGSTYQKMIASGVEPEKYLKENDSYNAFRAVGSLLITGPTGTNVNDLTLVIIN